MTDNTRGLRRVVRRLERRFLPAVPFLTDAPGKGALDFMATAPRHVWTHYNVVAGVDRPLECVVLSDLHVGSHTRDLERFEAIVREVDERPFDLLLLPGDFVNMQIFGGGRIRPETVADLLSPLLRKAPAVAVLGNHDNEYGSTLVASALDARGIAVLRNSAIRIETSGGALWVAGLSDHSTDSPDVARAMREVDEPSRSLVLAHDPASFASVPEGPIVTICGHTHAGQIRIPGFGAVVNASDAPMSWTHGCITERGRTLIVSAGLGTSGLPLRFNCPPEIVSVRIEPRGR